MTDSLRQPDGEAGSLPASDPDKRLTRRATEPLGVIDVRYAQRKYLRLVQWLAGRTSLLDRLRTVYGVEEALITGGRSFALQNSLGQQVDIFSTTILSLSPAAGVQSARLDVEEQDAVWDARPSSLAEIIAERSTDPAEQEAPPGGSFRVSRRPPGTLAGSVAELHVHSPRVTAKVQAPTPERISSSQQSHPDSDSPDTGSVSSPQQPRDANMHEAPINNHGPADFVLRMNSVESSVPEQADAIESTGTQEKPATATERNARAHSSVGRQSDGEISSFQSTGETKASPLPLTQQLTGDLFSKEMPEMVWRKQRVASQSHVFEAPETRASGPANSTQPKQSAFASRQEQRGRIGARAKALGSDEIRVEHINPQVIRTIAERVLRAITLDLKLERERRGVTKWR